MVQPEDGADWWTGKGLNKCIRSMGRSCPVSVFFSTKRKQTTLASVHHCANVQDLYPQTKSSPRQFEIVVFCSLERLKGAIGVPDVQSMAATVEPRALVVNRRSRRCPSTRMGQSPVRVPSTRPGCMSPPTLRCSHKVWSSQYLSILVDLPLSIILR